MFLNVIDIFLFIERFKIKSQQKKNLKLQMYEVHWAASVGGGPGLGGLLFLFLNEVNVD